MRYYYRKGQLFQPAVIKKLRFLYMGYRADAYFWEMIITLRKISLIMITVAFNSYIKIQAFLGLSVVYIAHTLHIRYNPFEFPELNRMEALSITCGGMSLYCGLYFVEKQLVGESIKWIFFFGLIIANFTFLLSWLNYFLQSFWYVYVHKYRK